MDGRLPPHGDALSPLRGAARGSEYSSRVGVPDRTLLLALSRGLSPACCKVLVALMMAGSALDVAALELWTGMQRDALGRALHALKGLDLVAPQTGPHNRQTWMPAGDSFFSAFQLSQSVTTEPYLLTTTIEARAVDQSQQQVFNGQLPQNVATGIEPPDRGPEFAASLAACAEFGIAEPVASELSAREWVNPRYIEAHVLSLQDWETRGLAVVRMRAGEAPPDWVKRGGESHRMRQERLRGKRNVYSGGAFAEYMQPLQDASTQGEA